MTGYRRDYAQLQRWAELEFAMLMLKIAVLIDARERPPYPASK